VATLLRLLGNAAWCRYQVVATLLRRLGNAAWCRYQVVATLLRRLGDVVVRQEVRVLAPSSLPDVTRSVRLEVGIGDRLRLELECNKWKYAVTDVSPTENAPLCFARCRYSPRFSARDAIFAARRYASAV